MKRSRKDSSRAASQPAVAPVAGVVETGVVEPGAVVTVVHSTVETLDCTGRHRLEFDVQHRLRTAPGLEFETLVVRRLPDGICLEGVLKSVEIDPDLADLVRKVAGVTRVLDRVVRTPKIESP
jgi:hypothetical protein